MLPPVLSGKLSCGCFIFRLEPFIVPQIYAYLFYVGSSLCGPLRGTGQQGRITCLFLLSMVTRLGPPSIVCFICLPIWGRFTRHQGRTPVEGQRSPVEGHKSLALHMHTNCWCEPCKYQINCNSENIKTAMATVSSIIQ